MAGFTVVFAWRGRYDAGRLVAASNLQGKAGLAGYSHVTIVCHAIHGSGAGGQGAAAVVR